MKEEIGGERNQKKKRGIERGGIERGGTEKGGEEREEERVGDVRGGRDRRGGRGRRGHTGTNYERTEECHATCMKLHFLISYNPPSFSH